MSSFVIRDALPADIPGCLALDHTFSTDQVWQMHLFQDVGNTQITFRTERLPRLLNTMHAFDERRMRLALPPEQCFLVAVERGTGPLTQPPLPPITTVVVPSATPPELPPFDEGDVGGDMPADTDFFAMLTAPDSLTMPEGKVPSPPQYAVLSELTTQEAEVVAPTPVPQTSPLSPPQSILAYLTMRYDPARRTAWVHDIVVDADLRRGRIGSRLLRAARRWAMEHDAARIMVEIPTRNYPAITFCLANGLTYCGYNDLYFENHDIAVFFGAGL